MEENESGKKGKKGRDGGKERREGGREGREEREEEKRGRKPGNEARKEGRRKGRNEARQKGTNEGRKGRVGGRKEARQEGQEGGERRKEARQKWKAGRKKMCMFPDPDINTVFVFYFLSQKIKDAKKSCCFLHSYFNFIFPDTGSWSGSVRPDSTMTSPTIASNLGGRQNISKVAPKPGEYKC